MQYMLYGGSAHEVSLLSGDAWEIVQPSCKISPW